MDPIYIIFSQLMTVYFYTMRRFFTYLTAKLQDGGTAIVAKEEAKRAITECTDSQRIGHPIKE